MTWIMLEGLDRTGKSSVAEIYRKKGFEVIHLSAPDKKYKEPGYAGPSYLDDTLELVMKHDGKDIVWDRSWHGELVWPHVYNRQPMLSEEDIEIFEGFEARNSAQRILMIDPDQKAHWQRCVDNKEPLNIQQFKVAGALFNKMAHKYNFVPHELKDYKDVKAEAPQSDSAPLKEELVEKPGQDKAPLVPSPAVTYNKVGKEEAELAKLETANAIRDVLAKRILKQKGGTFDKLEEDLKAFLKLQLSNIFTAPSSKVSLSEEEVYVLKVFCQRIKEKEKK